MILLRQRNYASNVWLMMQSYNEMKKRANANRPPDEAEAAVLKELLAKKKKA